MECREEAEKLAREYGLDPGYAGRIVCLLGFLSFRALHQVADKLALDLSRLKLLEIDPEGPRVILRLGGWERVREVYVDMSADGVEMVVSLEARKGLRKEDYEDAVATVIEESEQFQGIEEYDVTYSPGDGLLTVTLTARLASELPSVKDVVEAADKALGYYAAKR
jgi:hypothetical protein